MFINRLDRYAIIEFRLKIFAGNEDLDKINFHIIFSDKLSVENLKKKFLSQLKLKYDEISWNDAVDIVEKLEEFGRKWKEKATNFNCGGIYVKGLFLN